MFDLRSVKKGLRCNFYEAVTLGKRRCQLKKTKDFV